MHSGRILGIKRIMSGSRSFDVVTEDRDRDMSLGTSFKSLPAAGTARVSAGEPQAARVQGPNAARGLPLQGSLDRAEGRHIALPGVEE